MRNIIKSVRPLKWCVVLLLVTNALCVKDWNGRERRKETSMNVIASYFWNPQNGILQDKDFQFGYAKSEQRFWRAEPGTNIWKRIPNDEFVFLFSYWNVINEKDGPIFDINMVSISLYNCIKILEEKHPVFDIAILFQKTLADKNGIDLFTGQIVSPTQYVSEVVDWSIENITIESEQIIKDIEEIFKTVMPESVIEKIKTEIKNHFRERTNLDEAFGSYSTKNWTDHPTLLDVFGRIFHMKSNGIILNREDNRAIYGPGVRSLPRRLIALAPQIASMALENNEKLVKIMKHPYLFFRFIFF